MKKLYKSIFIIYIILCKSINLLAQQDTFNSISTSNGMKDLVINSIFKDSKGFVWFGTNSSIEKFDGVRLKRYEIETSNNKKRIYNFIEDPYYGILCGTDCGIYNYDKNSDRFLPLFKDVIDCKVNSIYRFSKDKLLVATEKGLYICTKGNATQSTLYGTFISPQNNTTAIVPNGDSLSVWISTMDGIVSYNPSTKSTVRYQCQNTELSNSFYNMTRIEDQLYLGTMENGIIKFDTKSHEYSRYINVGCNVISSLSSDNKDLLYVGTDGNGVHIISTKQNCIIKSYKHVPGDKGGIRSNSVYSVLVDRDSLLWIGHYQIGVDYTLYQSGLFNVYKWKEKFNTKDLLIRTISFNNKQRLIGSRDGLVFIDEKKDTVKSFKTPELRSNTIISSCYHKNKFYIGTYGGGMYVFDPKTLKISDFTITSDKTFINGHIFCIKPDYEGNLWIGTSTGLYCFNQDKQIYHFESSSSKIPEGNVYEIFFDSSNRGWICTETGTCLWDSNEKIIRNNVFNNNFANHEKIRTVYETTTGEIYFIPEKGEIFFTNKEIDKFNTIGNYKIFKDKQFLSIVEDKLGVFFLTTNNGLYRIDGSKKVIPFNYTDGIPDPIFTNCVSIRDSSGTFWFGNSKGLVYLKPEKIKNLKKNNYKIEITDVIIDGKKYQKYLSESGNIYNININDNAHNITVLFSGMIYTNPADMIYEYCINDTDNWVPLQGESKITLYNTRKNLKLKIRRAGYLESQIVLYINVLTNYTTIFSTIIILIGSILIYIYKKRIIKLTIGSLKKLILWLQNKEKRQMTNTISKIISNNEKVNINVEDYYNEKGNKYDTNEEKYKNYKLSNEECKRLIKILDKEITKNRLYADPSLKIGDLAKLVGSSSHALSYVFNQYLNKNYYDYINEYRVEAFKSAIQEDKYSKYTLDALSEHCGFTSRTSFFRSFKKATGITPNEYIKNFRKDQ